MRFNETPSGGRIASGTLPNGTYRVEWDADGNLISESCTIKEPPAPPPKPARVEVCPSCGGELVGTCSRHCKRCGLRLGCGD